MKPRLRFRFTAALLGLLAMVGRASGQSPAENSVYRRLQAKGPEAVAGLESVLKQPDESSALVLYLGAGVALREKRLEDAGFLFYVARFRALFDKEMFPPVGTGGNSPMLVFGALQQQLGSVINPALMAEPKAFAGALKRVKAWSPKVSLFYEPGWEYSNKKTKAEADAAIHDGRKSFLDGMGGIATLIQNAAYFASFQIAQNYNLKVGAERPTKEAYDAAMETMLRIEKETGIDGLASKSKR